MILFLVLRKVDWTQFREVIGHLYWRYLVASLALTCISISLRALRLSLVMGATRNYGAVWRSYIMGYLGSLVLPLGGGELLKIAWLRTQAGVSGTVAAASSLADRIFDIAGLCTLLTALAVLGTVIRVREGVIWVVVMAACMFALGTVWGVKWVRNIGNNSDASLFHKRVYGVLNELIQVLSSFSRPTMVIRLVVIQILIIALDVTIIRIGFFAFPFKQHASVGLAMKLSACLMLGSAMPLLPGGLGVHQAACYIALVPAGIDAAGALAFSLVGQVTTLLLIALLGLVAALGSSRNGPNPPNP